MMDVFGAIKYTKIARIDGGAGMNSDGVWLVNDAQLGASLVAKEISKARFQAGQDFWNECRLMHDARSEHVVSIRYGCDTGTTIALVMDHYPAGSLADRLASGPMGVRSVLTVGHHILHGVGALHAQGIVHFDVKPTNVFFDAADRAVVADFGQASRIVAGAAGQPRVYAFAWPPEWVGTGNGTPESDIYQVAVTLYRCLLPAGEFDRQKAAVWGLGAPGVAHAVTTGAFPDRDALPLHVPVKLRAILIKAMDPDPSRRFRSAAEFQGALADVEVVVDWVQSAANGGFEWRGTRAHGAPLFVAIRPAGGRWELEVATDGAGGLRRRTADCQTGLTYKRARQLAGRVLNRRAW